MSKNHFNATNTNTQLLRNQHLVCAQKAGFKNLAAQKSVISTMKLTCYSALLSWLKTVSNN